MSRASWAVALCCLGCPAGAPRASRELLDEGVPKGDSAVELAGVSMHRFDGDRVVLRGALRSARVDRDRGEATGEDVLITTLDAQGELRARIAAPRGRADLEHRRLWLEGGVRSRDREGRILTTEKMTYDGVADELEAPGPVVIEGQNFRAEGKSLRGHYQDEQLEVEGPVTARIAPKHP